jgi:DNA-binding XRE family transcriptional regulator
MKHRAAENYLKTHRKQSGLSQTEMGKLLGYNSAGLVFRHERSESIPSLANALAYEVIFGVPVGAIFVGLRDTIKHDVENKLQQMETALENRIVKDRDANLVAQKLIWLNERKSR